MPWQEGSVEMLRQEFVTLALQEDANSRALCRRFAISPDTGDSRLARYRHEGIDRLRHRSRRPHSSPTRTDPVIDAAVCAVRETHPAWGGGKIRRYLSDRGHAAVPAASPITDILRRHDLLAANATRTQRAWQRFAAAAPNDLWPLDFKGHIARGQGRCHPLTVLDDHSRYALALAACGDERAAMSARRPCRHI
jgi:transposase InsO family protein